MAGSCGCGDCKDCRRVREHVASLLPFRVVEAAAGAPLRISGVAMVAGISRNFNVYTPDELAAFAEKLVNAPLYLEHVSASQAVGKVTKCTYDAASRSLRYVAEVYDVASAEKIRNGLIRHVSVGADYQTMDLVDAKVPHGLYNAELSLVAVPGMPETTIQVLESLVHLHSSVPASGKDRIPVRVVHEKLSAKELLEPLQCVFCGKPGEYLVSVCTDCGDNAQSLVMGAMERLPVKELRLAVPLKEAEGDLPSHFTAFKVRFRCHGPNPCDRCKALDGKEFVYGTESEVPLHDGCQCSYELVERLEVNVNSVGVEKLDEKDAILIAEKVAVKLGEKTSRETVELKRQLAEAEAKDAQRQAQVERSQKYGIGIKAQNSSVATPSEYADVPEDMFADPVNYRYPVTPKYVQGALSYFNQPDNRSDYSAEEQAKVMAKIVQGALAAGIVVDYQPNDPVYKALPEELKAKTQGYTKEQTAVEKLLASQQTIQDQKTLIEKYRKVAPGVELTVDSPVLMSVSEHIAVLEKLAPPVMVERSSMGMQRQGQAVRAAILKAREKLEGN